MAAELAELRSALGLAEMSGAVFAVREALGLSPTTARLVLKLYSAAGRPVEKKALETALTAPGSGQCRAGSAPPGRPHSVRSGP